MPHGQSTSKKSTKKVVFQGGEKLPSVGSKAYKQSQQGIDPRKTGASYTVGRGSEGGGAKSYSYTVKAGDTANKIAQAHGFKNYKEAGISNFKSGDADKIGIGEKLTIGNYDPNRVKTIGSTSSVLSSKDNEQGFKTDSGKVDGLVNGLALNNDLTDTATEDATTEKGVDAEGKVTGLDPVKTKLDAWEKAQKKKLDSEAADRKRQYENLYRTSLAAIDATAASTIQGIRVSYQKRQQEQKRINELNIARVKAYGLSAGGQYTPIAFQDAITDREIEASDAITSLDNQRNSLIAEARSAQDQGQSRILRAKLEDLDQIDSDIRARLKTVASEAEAQYKLLRDTRKEEEDKHQKQIEIMVKRLTAIAPKYMDEYAGLDEKEKDAFIQKIADKTGVDYATVYGVLEGAGTTSKTDALKNKKLEADINATNALAEQRRREKGGNADMETDLPDSFKDQNDAEAKRKEFVKKWGVDGKKYWDSIYQDSVGDYQYDFAGKTDSGIKDRADKAGFDYDSMKAKGYSDDEIEKALDDAGL